MKTLLSTLFITGALALTACGGQSAETTTPQAKDVFKIGDISSYTAGAIFTEPARKGFTIGTKHVNADGGILGVPVEVISKDDLGNPADAIKVAENLVFNEKVDILTGCGLANVELALSDFAKRNEILYIPACTNGDTFLWGNGHRHAFRGGGTTLYTLNGALAKKAAETGKTRWVAVNHNYEWGQSNFETFKVNLEKHLPNVEWVELQWPAIGKIQAGAVVQAMKAAEPDGIYTSLWGSDLTEFLREGKKRGLLTDELIKVSADLGRYENLETFGAEMPEGWITTGMNTDKIETPMMQRFIASHKEIYGTDRTSWTGPMAYQTLFTIKTAFEKAGSFDKEQVIAVLEDNFEMEGMHGVPFRIRSTDHAPSEGSYVGTTAVVNGEAAFVGLTYVDGWDYLPPVTGYK